MSRTGLRRCCWFGRSWRLRVLFRNCSERACIPRVLFAASTSLALQEGLFSETRGRFMHSSLAFESEHVSSSGHHHHFCGP